MSIRDAINGLLGPGEPDDASSGQAGDTDPTSPQAALAAEGHGDLPAELFGTALGHYADLAPIETADALAPIVTRSGPVPYEDGDLPPIEGDDPLNEDGEVDTFALFEGQNPAALIVPAAGLAAVEIEHDPADEFDTDNDLEDEADLDDEAVLNEAVETDEADLDSGRESFADFGEDYGDQDFGSSFDDLSSSDTGPVLTDAGFGSGLTEPVVEESAPEFDEVDSGVAAQATAPIELLEAPDLDSLDDLEDEGSTNLFSVEFDDAGEDEGADPDDLDWTEEG